MAAWDEMVTASARRSNEALYRSGIRSSQDRTVTVLTEIRDTLARIEQLLIERTSNGESGETKGHSI